MAVPVLQLRALGSSCTLPMPAVPSARGAEPRSEEDAEQLPALLGNSIHGELWVPTSPSQSELEAGDVLACPLWDFTPAPLPAGRECDV